MIEERRHSDFLLADGLEGFAFVGMQEGVNRRLPVEVLIEALPDPEGVSWSEITDKPTEFPPESHGHAWSEVTDKPTEFPPEAHDHAWSEITDKPTEFPPEAHGHAWSEIADKPTEFPPEAHGHAWSEITDKPTEFPPEAHGHAWSEITDKPMCSVPGWIRGLDQTLTSTLTIAVGGCRSDDDADDIFVSSPITPAGLAWRSDILDTGFLAAGWYALWLIKNSSSGVVQPLLSLSDVSPTMPTGFTKKRRIGWLRMISGSANLSAFSRGDRWWLNEPLTDVTADTGTSATLRTLTAPPNTLAEISGRISHASAARSILITPPAQTGVTPSSDLLTARNTSGGNGSFQLTVLLNASSQVRVRADGASTVTRITTFGWIDQR